MWEGMERGCLVLIDYRSIERSRVESDQSVYSYYYASMHVDHDCGKVTVKLAML